MWRGEIPCHPVRGLVYVEIPKTGCTSVKHALAEYAGTPPEGDVHRWMGYTEARDLEQLQDWLQGRWAQTFSFTVMRDPLARFQSYYYGNHVYERFPDINDFVLHELVEMMSDIHAVPQTALVGDLTGFDYVGRTHNMAAVSRRLSKAARRRIWIERHNAGPPLQRQELSGASLRRLRDIYRADYEVLPG